MYGDDYDAFVEASRAEGFDARIEQPAGEYRSVDKEAVELGICVADHIVQLSAGGVLLDVVRRAARDTISKRKAARKSQRLRCFGCSRRPGSGSPRRSRSMSDTSRSTAAGRT